MSTKKEMLGKENRKEKGHRRYSLLLLALLFIGFASYGTYAYFTSTTSTSKGHLTLNGFSGDYTPGGTKNNDKNFEDKTGDGTTNIDTDNKNEYNPDPDSNGQGDGNGKFEEVVNKAGTSQDEAHNSTQFGEFRWVYVGNDVEAASSENLFTHSFDLKQYNSYITSNEDNTEFGNVVEGDVFRKTVRLAVNGTSKVPVTAQLIWNGVADEDINNITAAAYVNISYAPVISFGVGTKAYFFDSRLALGLHIGGKLIADLSPEYLAYLDVDMEGFPEIGEIIVTDFMIKNMNPVMFSIKFMIEYNQPINDRVEVILGAYTRFNVFKPKYITMPSELLTVAGEIDPGTGMPQGFDPTTPLPSYYLNSLDFGLTIGLAFKG